MGFARRRLGFEPDAKQAAVLESASVEDCAGFAKGADAAAGFVWGGPADGDLGRGSGGKNYEFGGAFESG